MSLGEVAAFRLAAGIVALSVLDDAFVHPEYGAGAGDHLASGLVPVALLAVAALAFPRLRPGGRAALALAVGVLAVTAGVADGLRHVLVDRFSGDDATALAAMLAGLGLLVLGVRMLWRSRRRDGPRGRRLAGRALRGLAAAVVAWLVVVPIAMAIVSTHKARAPIPAAELGTDHVRVAFTTDDGYRLAGWYVPSRNGAAVIAFPGRSGPVPHARMLARHGYGVLLFDRRGEGESEGDLNLYGWSGVSDLEAAITFLQGRPDVEPGRIGGLGLSVGGELLLETAARDERVRGVVSEGAGIRSLAEHLHMPELGAVQRWVTPWIVQTGAIAVLSNTGPPPDLLDLVPRIAPRPLLLIQAAHGAGGEELNAVYARAAGRPAALWTVPDGGHTGALAARPAEYDGRVTAFFDAALLGDLRKPSAAPGR